MLTYFKNLIEKIIVLFTQFWVIWVRKQTQSVNAKDLVETIKTYLFLVDKYSTGIYDYSQKFYSDPWQYTNKKEFDSNNVKLKQFLLSSALTGNIICDTVKNQALYNLHSSVNCILDSKKQLTKAATYLDQYEH